MSNVVAILSQDLCLGFSLAGIATQPVSSDAEAAEMMRAANEKKDYDLVIVDQKTMDGLDHNLRQELLRQTRPLFVPIPGDLVWSDQEGPGEDNIVRQLIRQAVGYQLNIHF